MQAEEIRIHAEELSKVWRTLDEERETRRKLEDHVANTSNTSSIQVFTLARIQHYLFLIDKYFLPLKKRMKIWQASSLKSKAFNLK